ncbi:MAG: NAD(P)H-binding protein [Solirubrobacterales bacterium]
MVAGATGYIGGLLARALRDDGVAVRCLVRDPAKARDLERIGCEIVRGDVLEPETLGPALEGVNAAYYLVHSMGRGSGGGFADRDATAANNFADAAVEAQVGRLIYLGGLGRPGSEHLRSRHQTAEILRASGTPLTYFRAAAVIGAGSESFRVVLYLVKRLPAMVTPRWVGTRTQPIAISDVVAYLREALSTPESAGREIQIGGPEPTTYGGMMDEMARALERRPPLRIPVPLLTPRLSSLWIGLVTPVDAGVAKPLIEGLATETIVTDPSGMALFEVEPTPLPQAMRAALTEAEAGA